MVAAWDYSGMPESNDSLVLDITALVSFCLGLCAAHINKQRNAASIVEGAWLHGNVLF